MRAIDPSFLCWPTTVASTAKVWQRSTAIFGTVLLGLAIAPAMAEEGVPSIEAPGSAIEAADLTAPAALDGDGRRSLEERGRDLTNRAAEARRLISAARAEQDARAERLAAATAAAPDGGVERPSSELPTAAAVTAEIERLEMVLETAGTADPVALDALLAELTPEVEAVVASWQAADTPGPALAAAPPADLEPAPSETVTPLPMAAGPAGTETAEPEPAESEPLPGEPVAEPEVAIGLDAPATPPPPVVSAPRDPSRPLPHPEVPELYQRVLTLPGARLHAQPWAGPAAADELPAFTVLYVYHEVEQTGQRWVEVGADAFGATDGWLPAEMVEEWHSMLVMQFAPRGQRERVLFFSDKRDLSDLVQSPWTAENVLETYEEIREGRHDPEVYVAIEPAAAVARDQLYLMPILQSQYERFANGTETTLLEVAGLNLSETAPQASLAEADQLGRVQPGLRDFKIGVAFVIDTTISMGPYIQETYQTVSRILRAFDQAEELGNIGFGLVGYRDDVSFNPAIEYVTRIYQPLDPNASPSTLLDNLGRARASSVPTADWNEDSFAGLETAIEELDWELFDARLVILITDAGPRLGTDPRAMHRDLDALNIVEMANRKNIAIVPVHLMTPEAARFDNIDYATQHYQRIARTGDFATNKYVGIETGSPEAFAAEIGAFADDLVASLAQARRGRQVEPTPLDEAAVETPRSLGAILVNELFRAQLEYLGRERGIEAPRFYRAWAADQDLVEPRNSAMTVNVFLARNQLSSLAQSLDAILEVAGTEGAAPQAFFEELQVLAAATSVEGSGRFAGGTIDEVTGADLLPAFLRILPYRSKALTLDRQTWLDFGQTGQEEFLNELRAKRRAYREIYEDTDNWVDLGAGDPALEVYPMALSLLP